LRSGDFLKLRTVELGVSMPEKLIQKWRMKKARLFVGAFNLITFSGLKNPGIDPETPVAGRDGNYPYVKTFTVGINVKF
jgi:TonB-dependent starch-binding outer membrane protein SusC